MKFLEQRLNPMCRRALDEAAAQCAARGQETVQAAHLLHALLAQESNDIRLMLAAFRLNAAHWRRALELSIERLPGGPPVTPAMDTTLQAWLQDAWSDGALRLEQSHIRSGALLMALARHPGKYRLPVLPGIAELQQRQLLRQFERYTAESVELTLFDDTAAPPPELAATVDDQTVPAQPPPVHTAQVELGETEPFESARFTSGDTQDGTGAVTQNLGVPDKLGKYEIRTRIASGSMGVVYLGHDAFINRDVAIKVARADTQLAARDAAAYRRTFFNELHTAGMLNHPNVLAVYDAGVDDEQYYIVMEYVRGGRTLADFTDAESRAPLNTVIEMMLKCARALHYAHARGVIHRDIKPSNILVTDELDVKIADFSIAVIHRPDKTLTQAGGLIGSPRYMSPEQTREEKLTHRTDLYSLGVVMYELLAGRPPFIADTLPKLVHDIGHAAPEPIGRLRPDLPGALVDVLQRAMHKDPAQRYADGQALAEALSQACRPPGSDDELLRIGRLHALRAYPPFAAFSTEALQELIDAGTWLSVVAGDVLVAPGDADDAFHFVLDGKLSEMQGRRRLRELGPGESFGELGFVRRRQHQARIQADEPATVLRVGAADLEPTSQTCQLLFHKALELRLAETLS